MTIAGEIKVFLSAIFSGIFLYSFYQVIGMLRKAWKHRMFLTNLEDFVYWGVCFAYLIVQIYHTNNGIIRGYYALGIVFGAWFMWKTSLFISKWWKNFVQSRMKKRLDKMK